MPNENTLRKEFFEALNPEAPHTEENFQAYLCLCAMFDADPQYGYKHAKSQILASMDMMSHAFEEYGTHWDD